MIKTAIKETIFVGLDVTTKIGLDRILQTVCNHLKVEVHRVKSRNRLREYCTARHIYCYLATQSYGGHTLVNIGKEINRDHASVLHAKRKITNYLEIGDSSTTKVVNYITGQLGYFGSGDVENKIVTPAHVGYYRSPERKEMLKKLCDEHDVVSRNKLNR
jgi:hypothetical protein